MSNRLKIPITSTATPTEQLWGGLNLIFALVLGYCAFSNFSAGKTYLPMGFGLMSFYCLYLFARYWFKVKFNRAVILVNFLLLLGALFCLVVGVLNNN